MNEAQLTHLKLATEDTPEFTLESVKTLCKVVDVYDGDTVKVVFYYKDELLKWTVRLYGINTPETRTRDLVEKEKGIEATKKLLETCDYSVQIKSHGLDKYGRSLAEIMIESPFIGTINLNQYLLNEGFAEESMKN